MAPYCAKALGVRGHRAARHLLGIRCRNRRAERTPLAALKFAYVFVLRDFRIERCCIVLLPISNTYLFPRAMLGITGLNPVNLLLLGTLASYLLHGLFDGSLRRFMPRPLLWLYIVPFIIAGALGSSHVGDIAPGLYRYILIEFDTPTSYIRDAVVKPLSLVIFALLVGAAMSRSAKWKVPDSR